MATQNPTLPINPNADDATFRSWASAISAAIQALGLVQTGDTGQINLATVTRPAGDGAAGYEVYRFADTLQSSTPCFIKIEYGLVNSAPSLWLTVGLGTNGSGTLSGAGSRRNLQLSAAPEAGQDVRCYLSGDTGRLSFALYASSAGGRVLYASIERSKAADGSKTADAILMSCAGGYNGAFFDAIGPGLAAYNQAVAMAVPPSETTAVNGADVICFTPYPPPRFSRYGLHGFLGFMSGDISVSTQFSVDPDGNGAHNYMALPTLAQSPTTVNSGARFAVRYD